MKHNLLQLPKRLFSVAGIARWALRDRSRHYFARLHRARLDKVTFVAITGSAGKTTTKDLGAAILSRLGACYKNRGSTNQHAHVDQAVLETTRDHKYSVLEVSASRPGYLDRPLRVVQPCISVLTIIARDHYSAFGSLQAIANEKGKLVSALPPGGTAVLNIDDPLIHAIGQQHGGRIVWFGKDEMATLRLLDCTSNWPEPLSLRVMHEGEIFHVRTRLHGTHLALPVLAALGIGVAAGARFDDMMAALAGIDPTEGRMQIDAGEDGIVFVRDDWKAPHWSLPAPFQFMRDARALRKVIVLGAISDSPRSPSQRYTLAARHALDVADLVVLVGPHVLNVTKVNAGPDKSLKAFPTIREAASFLRQELRTGDLVLLKGTNKQDHLVRLVMDRRQPVQCWRTDCGIPRFCNTCRHAYAAPSTRPPQAETLEHSRDASILAASCVIVGLGNEGPEYRDTPHNVGQRALDFLAESRATAWERHPEGWVSTIQLKEVTATLLKPAGKTNSCGPVIARFLERAGRSVADCIVVHDDMDLELGGCRLSHGSGDGGHKGVRSVIVALGTNSFPRIRLGVRRPADSRRAKDMVLERFSGADAVALETAFTRTEAELESLLAKRQKDSVALESAA